MRGGSRFAWRSCSVGSSVMLIVWSFLRRCSWTWSILRDSVEVSAVVFFAFAKQAAPSPKVWKQGKVAANVYTFEIVLSFSRRRCRRSDSACSGKLCVCRRRRARQSWRYNQELGKYHGRQKRSTIFSRSLVIAVNKPPPFSKHPNDLTLTKREGDLLDLLDRDSGSFVGVAIVLVRRRSCWTWLVTDWFSSAGLAIKSSTSFSWRSIPPVYQCATTPAAALTSLACRCPLSPPYHWVRLFGH